MEQEVRGVGPSMCTLVLYDKNVVQLRVGDIGRGTREWKNHLTSTRECKNGHIL
jgi:hypothetical protein